MITKEQRLSFFWETDKVEVLQDLSRNMSDSTLSTLYEYLYTATVALHENYLKLSSEQREVFNQQIAQALGVNSTMTDNVDFPEPEYISTSDASKLLGITPQAVRKWCEQGKLDAKKTFDSYGEWRIKTDQFMRNPEMKSKYRSLCKEKQEKQLRTHQAIKDIKHDVLSDYKELLTD